MERGAACARKRGRPADAPGGEAARSPKRARERGGAMLPRIFLDEKALREHNAALDVSVYRRETSVDTGIWDLPFRVEPMLDRVRLLGGACGTSAKAAHVVRVHEYATLKDISRVASAKYRRCLEDACGDHGGDDKSVIESGGDADKAECRFLDGDKTTLLTPTTVECARYGAGSVLAAASYVFARRGARGSSHSDDRSRAARRAFVVARPPGHHNSCCDLIEEQFDIDEGTLGNFVWGCHGGCVFNNVAMAIRMLQHEGESVVGSGAVTRRRFAVVDIDAHFGDGTALQFWNDASVLTISIHWSQHESGSMYPFLQGGSEERGGGDARGTNLNLPLPDGSDDVALSRAINNAILSLRAFCPSGIFVACGFDGLDTDLSSKLRFTPAGYGAAVGALVEAFPSISVLVSWEGGYTEERQADAFEAVVRALAGQGQPSCAAGCTSVSSHGTE